MGTLKKVERVLEGAFPPPAKLRLRDDDGIIGIVTSERFQGLDFIDRQNLIWSALENSLTGADRKKIVNIIAVTPDEEIAHLGS